MEFPHKQTIYLKVDPENVESKQMETMAEVIREGGVVAFPTETVYGLGANALDAKAIIKIFQAKGRPSDNPLIVHISDTDLLKVLTNELPKTAQKAIEAFWPGPLTIVVTKKPILPDEVTAGLDTVGIRMPDNKVALSFITAAKVPIAAPSANVSGRPSPTTAEHVAFDLSGKIDAIIDGGSTKVGLESTVVDFTSNIPTILRPGSITFDDLKRVLGKVKYDSALINNSEKPKAPGMKYTHYAPEAEMLLVEGELPQVVDKIKQLAVHYSNKNKKVGIMTSDETQKFYKGYETISLGSRNDLESIASNLFSTLRKFDDRGVDILLAETFEDVGIGVALMNRLKKAAGFRIIKA